MELSRVRKATGYLRTDMSDKDRMVRICSFIKPIFVTHGTDAQTEVSVRFEEEAVS